MPRPKTPRNGNATKKQPQAGVINIPGNGHSAPVDVEAEIRMRAYELYEQRGCTSGSEREDWLMAEREIAARHQHQGA